MTQPSPDAAPFPYLTPPRRNSLMKILNSVKERPDEVTAFATAAKANQNGLKLRLQNYTRLQETVLAQFPETRAEQPDESRFTATNAFLNKTLKLIDRECAIVMGVAIADLNYWFKTGELSPFIKAKQAKPTAKGRKK